MFQTGQVHAGAAADRRGGACGGRARAPRRLPFARRVSGRPRGARRRLRGRRQLQVPARRSGRVLPLRRSASSRCRDSRTLDIGWFAKESPFAYARPDPPRYAAGGDALARIDAGGAAALPGARRAAVHAGDRRRAAARLFARACSGGSSRCSPSAESRRAAGRADRGAFVVVRHRAATRARGGRSKRAASSPMPAASGCASAPTC